MKTSKSKKSLGVVSDKKHKKKAHEEMPNLSQVISIYELFLFYQKGAPK